MIGQKNKKNTTTTTKTIVQNSDLALVMEPLCQKPTLRSTLLIGPQSKDSHPLSSQLRGLDCHQAQALGPAPV